MGDESPASPGDGETQHPLDKDAEEMTRAELRGYIARIVGTRTKWETPLDKVTLNSVYAHLTGEFCISRRVIHNPDHPDFRERMHVLVAVVIEASLGEYGDEWLSRNGDPPGELRRDELLDLVTTLKETPDRRDWTRTVATGGS